MIQTRFYTGELVKALVVRTGENRLLSLSLISITLSFIAAHEVIFHFIALNVAKAWINDYTPTDLINACCCANRAR